jgi:hypothetical protein
MTELACAICGLDPQSTSLLVPMAQAAAISVPFLLRTQILRGVRAVWARGPGKSATVGVEDDAASCRVPGQEADGDRRPD